MLLLTTENDSAWSLKWGGAEDTMDGKEEQAKDRAFDSIVSFPLQFSD